MIKIINGKRYNTDTAEQVCSVRGCRDQGNFYWEDTYLYRSPKGAWFLAGKGNAMSRWGKRDGYGGHCQGAGILPLDAVEAREMLEQHGTSEDVERWFESEITDA